MTRRPPVTRRRLLLAALVPIALTAVVYAHVGRFDFVELDDPYYVYNNPDLSRLHGWAVVRFSLTSFTVANWHPLTWLSYFADRDLYQLRPGPMHVENAALHGVAGVLVLLLLFDAAGHLGRATACAALFAVHPQHVESVAWISERKDVLSTAWLLAAACAHVRFAKTNRRRWYAALLGCYAISLSAKPMGVTLPAVLLLLDGWPLDRLAGAVRRRVVEKVPLLAMAAAVSAATVLAQRSYHATQAIATTPTDRACNAAVAVVRYVADSVWPTRLAAFYPYRRVPTTAAVASVTLLAGLTVVAVRARRRRPYVLVGWLWFLGTLLPVSGLLAQVGMAARADRYTYFPSIGLSVAVVWLAADVLPLAPLFAAAAVTALTVVARHQCGYWKDNQTLFAHAAAVTDDNYLAEDELAREALRRGDGAAALDHLRRALTANADFAPALADTGRYFLAIGQFGPAETALERAVELAPHVPVYRSDLDAARRGSHPPPN